MFGYLFFKTIFVLKNKKNKKNTKNTFGSIFAIMKNTKNSNNTKYKELIKNGCSPCFKKHELKYPYFSMFFLEKRNKKGRRKKKTD